MYAYYTVFAAQGSEYFLLAKLQPMTSRFWLVIHWLVYTLYVSVGNYFYIVYEKFWDFFFFNRPQIDTATGIVPVLLLKRRNYEKFGRVNAKK